LDFLLNLVINSSNQDIFFIKKKTDDLLVSSYDNKPLHLDNTILQQLNKMISFLMKPLLSEYVKLDSGFYICDVVTGKCTCWEYIWNSSIRDKCRHCHAAILFQETQKKESIEVMNETKKELVQYFRNKERVNPAAIKNNIIYQSTIENSFKEIIRLYNIQGKYSVFFLKKIYIFIKIVYH